MALQVYSTLSRKKEPFPKKPGDTVSMYVCGPTVYKPSHIGHMVGPVIFDTVKRYLTYLGYKVDWVVNITDVDDKLINRARETKTSVKDLAVRMTADYLECLKQLNVTGIDQLPKATEHIGEMIAMIQKLIDKGFAYPANGDVYFDISRDNDYGKLCGFDPEQLEAGSRIEVSDKKRNPGDFALWKGAKPGEPPEVQFDSPWGKGRPGWHIECSAMSTRLLGDTLDIHGGGLDLRFPHHEDELAQSESATGQTFARIWMHNGLLKMGKGKMAGSVGNVINVADALKHVSGEVIRFFFLTTHYRSPIDLGDFDPATQTIPPGLENAQKALENFYRFFERAERITGENFYRMRTGKLREDEVEVTGPLAYPLPVLRKRFLDCMDDDFNTGGAVGVLFELLTTLNRFADEARLDLGESHPATNEFRTGVLIVRELSNILGLFWKPATAAAVDDPKLRASLRQLLSDLGKPAADDSVASLMQAIIDLRQSSRKSKDFKTADIIRLRLGELGVTLEDRPGGTDWRMG
jgi:cysteinyl-tRNA synthetase